MRGVGIAILFMALVMSCKTTQNINTKTVDYSNCKVAALSADDLMNHYDSITAGYQWIKIKTNIKAQVKDESVELDASLRIRKDSLVYGSLSKAGITVAKFLATKDSIQLIDIFHKKQKKGSYNEIDSILGFHLPFEILENLFFGIPTHINDPLSYQPAVGTSSVNFKSSTTQLSQVNSFSCDTINLISTLLSNDSNLIETTYNNPEDINDVTLNKNITLTAKKGDNVVLLLELEITRVKFYDSLKIPFDVPSDYEKMD